MQLYLNATSPFARVARIVAMEKGLAEAVTLCWCDPWSDDASLLAANPVGRVPTLVTDEGTALSEALLIAQYLDATGEGESLLPPTRLGRVLSLAGLGQGLMEAAFNTVIARKHNGPEVDASNLGQRRLWAIPRILQRLEDTMNEAPPKPPRLTLGDIVVGVALEYLSFRLPEFDWAADHAALAGWHTVLIGRDSFRATAFG
ncbi:MULTISPECIES: glutathione S-transferase N-terminal domain-containing protein [Halomonadaceae]|uniref:glutathione S-transferase N-terminal domain-containing protein n=1 Tax=Halomonadaceae TaxID=28256 RepID=UPI00159A796E|nr:MULTISPECIES: glutathione S-transferase N-terminal domain-containing protein [Halomonas]QJQ95126.1 glutathione S-transferase [Halomonas sp. PA5]